MSDRKYPDRPYVGIGAVIVHEGRVVLVKRRFEPLAGQWSIPGGAVEAGEQVVHRHVGHPLAGGHGRRAHVRHHQEIRGIEQRMIARKRLWIRHVQCGAGQLTRV